MSIWDGVPYELQSPAWRNATNGSGSGTWDPTLNLGIAGAFLEAQRNANNNAASTPAAAGVNTKQIDGSSQFFGALTQFGGALLGSIGVRDDTPAPAVYTASAAPASGFDLKTVAVVGLVGAAIFYALRK